MVKHRLRILSIKYTDRVQSTMSTDQKRKVSRVSSARRCADSEICNRRNLKCACFSFGCWQPLAVSPHIGHYASFSYRFWYALASYLENIEFNTLTIAGGAVTYQASFGSKFTVTPSGADLDGNRAEYSRNMAKCYLSYHSERSYRYRYTIFQL
jgi:hypothetical protein